MKLELWIYEHQNGGYWPVRPLGIINVELHKLNVIENSIHKILKKDRNE